MCWKENVSLKIYKLSMRQRRTENNNYSELALLTLSLEKIKSIIIIIIIMSPFSKVMCRRQKSSLSMCTQKTQRWCLCVGKDLSNQTFISWLWSKVKIHIPIKNFIFKYVVKHFVFNQIQSQWLRLVSTLTQSSISNCPHLLGCDGNGIRLVISCLICSLSPNHSQY